MSASSDQDIDGDYGSLFCSQAGGLTPKRSQGAQKLSEARRRVIPTRHYPLIVEQDGDGVFIVDCPVFPGCHSYGITFEDAMDNIREAIELCRAVAWGLSPRGLILKEQV